MTSNGSEQPLAAPGPPSAAGPARRRADLGRLRRVDLAVAAGTVLYLVFMSVPWFSVDAFDLGFGYAFPGRSANGFDSGLVVTALVLLVLATAWSLLPAVADVPVPFPRALVTVGLATAAAVLTFVEWLATFDGGFTLMGLLTFLTSLAVLGVTALRPPAEFGAPGALPGVPGAVARWGDRPARRRGVAPGAAPPAENRPAPPSTTDGTAAPAGQLPGGRPADPSDGSRPGPGRGPG